MYTTAIDVSCFKVSLFIKFRIESLGTYLAPKVHIYWKSFNDYKLFVTSRTAMLSYYITCQPGSKILLIK